MLKIIVEVAMFGAVCIVIVIFINILRNLLGFGDSQYMPRRLILITFFRRCSLYGYRKYYTERGNGKGPTEIEIGSIPDASDVEDYILLRIERVCSAKRPLD